MNIQSTKLELIKEIADIQSERLLNSLKQFLKQENKTQSAKSDKPLSFSKEESKLLLKINEGLPEKIQSKYNVLNEKLLRKTLTEKEHAELLKLIQIVEAKNVERLQCLTQLAILWETDVDEVMNRLKIKSPPVIHA